MLVGTVWCPLFMLIPLFMLVKFKASAWEGSIHLLITKVCFLEHSKKLSRHYSRQIHWLWLFSLDLASKPNSTCSQEPFGIYKAKNSSKTLPQLFGNARDKFKVSQMQRHSLPLRCISGLPCNIPFEVM